MNQSSGNIFLQEEFKIVRQIQASWLYFRVMMAEAYLILEYECNKIESKYELRVEYQ